MIRLLNRERARKGCRPVRIHRTVTGTAQRHSDYMARVGVLSHTGPHTSGPGDRLTDEGYRWRRAAENLARSQPNAATAFPLWKAGPKHRAAMLTCSYRHAGVARQNPGRPGLVDTAPGHPALATARAHRPRRRRTRRRRRG
ncbi:CAP domain-containing protein [Streptomyces sp. NPDC055287]